MWPQPESEIRPQVLPQRDSRSAQERRLGAKRTIMAAATSFDVSAFPQAQRWPQRPGVNRHSPHGPSWHNLSQVWYPQESFLPQMTPQLKSESPHGLNSLERPQWHLCSSILVQGGHFPGWQRSGQGQPQAKGLSQGVPQDHVSGSPHLVADLRSAPQWHEPGPPTAVHGGHGPGWQSSGQACGQPSRLRPQGSPQL